MINTDINPFSFVFTVPGHADGGAIRRRKLERDGLQDNAQLRQGCTCVEAPNAIRSLKIV